MSQSTRDRVRRAILSSRYVCTKCVARYCAELVGSVHTLCTPLTGRAAQLLESFCAATACGLGLYLNVELKSGRPPRCVVIPSRYAARPAAAMCAH